MRLGLAEIALKQGRKALEDYSKAKASDSDNDGRDDLAEAALGVVACGKFGDETDIDRLAKLIDEKVVIRTWITEDQDTYTCELRDLASLFHSFGGDGPEGGWIPSPGRECRDDLTRLIRSRL